MDGLRKCRGEAKAERWPSLEQGQDTLATARFVVDTVSQPPPAPLLGGQNGEVQKPDFPLGYIPQSSAEEEEIVLGHSPKPSGGFPGETEFRLGFRSLKRVALSKSPMRGSRPPAQAEESSGSQDVAMGRDFQSTGRSPLMFCTGIGGLFSVERYTFALQKKPCCRRNLTPLYWIN